MSEQRGPEVSFTHYNDCHSSGCPGHKLRAILDTSGYLRFEEDGQVLEFGSVFDPDLFVAMVEAEKAGWYYYRMPSSIPQT